MKYTPDQVAEKALESLMDSLEELDTSSYSSRGGAAAAVQACAFALQVALANGGSVR